MIFWTPIKLFNVDTNNPAILKKIALNMDLLDLKFFKITFNVDSTGLETYFNYISDFPFC